jgi:2-polyprenyl-6-methoxyphenol hydroxylase-like FAD-dependent oxidoreductase
MANRSTVLIAGAGPVGLTLANELVRHGVSVRIVDKAAARTDKSKALVLWSRSLELFDDAGYVEQFLPAGFPAHGAQISTGKEIVARVSLDSVDSRFPYALMIPQSETERILEERLAVHRLTVERSVELTAFTDKGTSVEATLKKADGATETLEADWLVGCDGAHSSVRHGLNFAFEGSTQESHWALADGHISGIEPNDRMHIFWHRDGILAFFPIVGDRWRVVADLGHATDGARQVDPTLAEINDLLARRGSPSFVMSDPLWLASFRINERKVKDYRKGRVFLAGDAAHIHSPAGGQGMNTGMQDAINLAWKLALVCRGEAAEEPLLDSYSTERSEIGRQVLANAGRLTQMAMLKGALLQGLRNHMAALLFGLSPVRRAMNNVLAELSIGYPDGPLTAVGAHLRGGPAAGARVPPTGQPIGAGRAPRFALFGAACEQSDALIRQFPALLEGEIRAPFTQGGIWLARPDGYVALAAAQGDWQRVAAYLARIAPV